MGSTVGLSVSSAILQQVIRLVLTRDLSGSQYDVDEVSGLIFRLFLSRARLNFFFSN